MAWLALLTEETVHERSLVYTRKDGSTFPVSVTAAVPREGQLETVR